MTVACQKCSAQLEPLWKFCPHCGSGHANAPRSLIPTHAAHEPAPAKRAFGGLLLGLVAAPVLIIYGGMICLTGLGVFLGIPMIVAGVCAPLIGSLMGLNGLQGICPWCGVKVSGVGIFDRFSCPACSKRIVVRKHELMRAS